ncbi:10465_t:CDS:1, partial [Scutellospora calospora]
KYVIFNEMSTILSQHETINSRIIVRLSESLQQEYNNILPFNSSINQQHERCQTTLQKTEIEVRRYEKINLKVKRWLEEIQRESEDNEIFEKTTELQKDLLEFFFYCDW